MKRSSLLLLILPFILFSFGHMANDESKAVKKWAKLFNGKNLDGWKMKIAGFPLGENFGNTFRVENGILSIRYDQYGDNFNNRFGALYFNKRLTNYRLKVEYRFVGETAPGAPTWGFRDSGVQYHGQDPASIGLAQSFPVCLEYNLHGGNGKEERPTGEICTPGTTVEINGKKNESFCTPPTVKRTFHGDQWVTLEIDVRDGKIVHFVNGEEILRFENPKYNPTHEFGKTFIVNGNDVVKDGFVSLQSNSHPIDFRKIEIMEY
ncbi:MAG: DUF1080 domain-containing protein [Marivirga sp.]|nr:DUF1080 domain-containing protein [Marivirga sp.]